jgi:triacylglycerol lipase
MSIRSLYICLILLTLASVLPAEDRPQETVVLLHGILNRPFVMNKIQKGLEKNGFRVLNWGYQSTEKTIEEYTVDLKTFVESQKLTHTVHFVGFSLGSIIARNYLSTTPPLRLGRFVQIAPPNHGSQRAATLSQYKTFRWILGDKAFEQMKPDSAFLKSLGLPSCAFGIIVGGRGDGKGYSDSLPGDDDGTVSLESSRLEGAKDIAQVPSTHTLLLAQDETVQNVVAFLKDGNFQ